MSVLYFLIIVLKREASYPEFPKYFNSTAIYTFGLNRIIYIYICIYKKIKIPGLEVT